MAIIYDEAKLKNDMSYLTKHESMFFTQLEYDQVPKSILLKY